MAEEPEEQVEETTQPDAAAEGDAAAEVTADAVAEAEAEAPAAEAPAAPKGPQRKSKRKRAEAMPKDPEERRKWRIERRAQQARVRQAYRARLKTKRAESRPTAAGPEPTAEAAEPGRRKVRQGVVVSDRGDKTIVVRIDIARRHRRYEKIMRTSTKLHAHDETNDAHTGDIVRIVETRPLSKTKRWRLAEVLERAK